MRENVDPVEVKTFTIPTLSITAKSESDNAQFNEVLVTDPGDQDIYKVASNMMTFPRPRVLMENRYPDSPLSHPQIFETMVQSTINPPQHSPMDAYLQQSIDFLKEMQRKKGAAVKLNNCTIGSNLYFTNISLNRDTGVIKCLVDTGATNSLIHSSIAKQLNLKVQPIRLKLATATGVSEDAIKGISHVSLHFHSSTGKKITFCTNIIVSDQLNGLQAILGAEFLLDATRVHAINGTSIMVIKENTIIPIPVFSNSADIPIQSNFTALHPPALDNKHLPTPPINLSQVTNLSGLGQILESIAEPSFPTPQLYPPAMDIQCSNSNTSGIKVNMKLDPYPLGNISDSIGADMRLSSAYNITLPPIAKYPNAQDIFLNANISNQGILNKVLPYPQAIGTFKGLSNLDIQLSGCFNRDMTIGKDTDTELSK